MNIGTILKELRIERNLTQYELANALKIGQATIAGYENNTREPRINILNAYANFFECSIDFLVGREDDFGNILIPFAYQKNDSTAELSPDGKELLDIYNALAPEYKAQILEYARYFQERTSAPKKNKF